MRINMRALIRTVLALGLLSGVLCRQSRAEEHLKIGVLAPLSGSAAFFGNLILDGIRLAGAQDSHIKLLLEDSRYDSKTALSAYRKLRASDDIKYLISVGGATCEVLNRETQREQVVHIAVGCNTARFTAADSYNFRLDVNEEVAATLLAGYLKKQGVKSAALVNIQNTWGETVAKFTREAFLKTGIKITDQITFSDSGVGDLRASLAKLKKDAPQRIFLVAPPEAVALVLKQFREQHVNIPLVSTIAIENEAVLRLAGADAEGIVYLSVRNDPRTRAAWPEYYARFGEKGSYAAWGFDAVKLLAQAQASGKAKQFLQSLKGYVGAYNIYGFNAQGELAWPYEMRIIHNGRFESLAGL